MINVYQLGDVVTLTKVFDSAPTELRLVVNPPDGEVVVYTADDSPASITAGASSDYSLELDADQAGTWYFEWKSSEGVEIAQFVVIPSNAPEPEA